MTTTPSPFAEFDRLRSSMDRMFDRRLSLQPRFVKEEAPGTQLLSVDIRETEEAYVVTAAVPGMKQEDVSVSAENGLLTIKGDSTREEPEGDESGTYLRREIAFGAFERSIRLPKSANVEEASASFADGLLTVTLPKRDEVKARTIEVTAAE